MSTRNSSTQFSNLAWLARASRYSLHDSRRGTGAGRPSPEEDSCTAGMPSQLPNADLEDGRGGGYSSIQFLDGSGGYRG